MKKTLATAATLLILVSALSFANGTKEDSTQRDLITKTGTLKLVPNDHPELVTKDGTYELMYPYMYADDIKLTDGQKITVKGYDVPAYRDNNSGDDKHLMVTEATINGKEYKLDTHNFGPMGRNRGPRGGSNQRRGGRW